MRWDQSFRAAAAAGLIVVCGAAPAVFSDMRITGNEVWMLLTAFGGTFFAYLKAHPPTF